MRETESIRVNFARPMPVFPLDTVELLPQQVLQLHIFEPRYRQMVADVLDASGQIAVGVFDGDAWREDYHNAPPLRESVCVGHMVDHRALPDGRYDIALQGVCRARILDEVPAQPDRMYRLIMLEPIDAGEESAPGIDRLRAWIGGELSAGPLQQMSHAAQVLEYVRDDRVPTPALLELVSYALVSDTQTRYELLSEPRLAERAKILRSTLEDLDRLIRLVQHNDRESWPKGLSWN